MRIPNKAIFASSALAMLMMTGCGDDSNGNENVKTVPIK